MKNPRVRRAVKKGRKKQIFAAAHLRGEGGGWQCSKRSETQKNRMYGTYYK